MNDFHEDLKRASLLRDVYLKRLYAVICENSEFVCLDGNDLITIELQKMQIDAIGTSLKTKRTTYYEEKYDFHPPNNFCFETVSNTTTNPEVPGWMKTAKSDVLIYSFAWIENILDVYMLDFPQLRKWFWSVIDSQEHKWREHIVPDSSNRTASRLVPVKQVIAEGIYTNRYLITMKGSIIPIHPLDNPYGVLNFHGLPFIPLTKDDSVA